MFAGVVHQVGGVVVVEGPAAPAHLEHFAGFAVGDDIVGEDVHFERADLGLEAGGGKVAGDGLGNLAEGGVVTTEVDRDGGVGGEFGFGDEFLRAGEVEGDGFLGGVVAEGEGALEAGDRFGVALQDLFDDLVAIDGHDHGFAEFGVSGGAVAGVEAQDGDGGTGDGDQGEVGAVGDGRGERNGDLAGDVDAAGLEFGDLGVGFDDEFVDDLVEFRCATPVGRVGFERELDFVFVAGDFERAGADRGGGEALARFLGDVFGRYDHGAVAGEFGEHHRVGPFQHDVDGVGVDDFDGADRGVVGLLRTFGAFGAEQALDGEFYRFGVEGFAVVEGDAFAEFEAEAQAVVELFPGGGEAGFEVELFVADDQAVEDVGGDGAPGDEEGGDGVPIIGVLGLGDGEGAGGVGLGDRGDGDGGGEEKFVEAHGPGLRECLEAVWPVAARRQARRRTMKAAASMRAMPPASSGSTVSPRMRMPAATEITGEMKA